MLEDVRQKLGSVIAGRPLDGASGRGLFCLISTRSLDDAPNKLRAGILLDKFARDTMRKLNSPMFDQLVEELLSKPEVFSRLHAISGAQNKLVNNGSLQWYRMATGQATNSIDSVAIASLPTMIQLGEDPAATLPTDKFGCKDPLVAPAGLVVAAATITPVTTDGNYPKDTVQWRKTNFTNDGIPPITVSEAAILNTDTPKIAFCRTPVTPTVVAPAGNLDVTYQFQLRA